MNFAVKEQKCNQIYVVNKRGGNKHKYVDNASLKQNLKQTAYKTDNKMFLQIPHHTDSFQQLISNNYRI